MATISEALALAVQHHEAGRLQDAEQIYRQILAVEPDQPDALHLLGVIAYQMGNPEVAIEHIQRAIRLNGSNSAFHGNLGNAFRMQGKLDESIACYRRALELQPDFAQVHYNLGNTFQAQGKADEAIACYRRALELKPDFAEARNNLGHLELDYVERWRRAGGSLHGYDEIQDFDAYLQIEGWFDFQDIYDSAVAEARSGGLFVEVGCWKGRSTAYLGSRVALAQKQVSIFAIDPWLGWDDGRAVSTFGHFLKNIDVAGLIHIVTPLRMISTQAARLFEDASVDFCFIDGDHRYEAVSEDLRAWFPKIRSGGLIGGHDYVGPDSPGVKRAVDEFFKIPVQVSGKSWLTRKGP